MLLASTTALSATSSFFSSCSIPAPSASAPTITGALTLNLNLILTLSLSLDRFLTLTIAVLNLPVIERRSHGNGLARKVRVVVQPVPNLFLREQISHKRGIKRGKGRMIIKGECHVVDEAGSEGRPPVTPVTHVNTGRGIAVARQQRKDVILTSGRERMELVREEGVLVHGAGERTCVCVCWVIESQRERKSFTEGKSERKSQRERQTEI